MTQAVTPEATALLQRWGWTQPAPEIMAMAERLADERNRSPRGAIRALGLLDDAELARLEARCPRAIDILSYASREEPTRVTPLLDQAHTLIAGYPYYRSLALLQPHNAMSNAAVLRRCEELDCVLLLVEDTTPTVAFSSARGAIQYATAGRAQRMSDPIASACSEPPVIAVASPEEIAALITRYRGSDPDTRAETSVIWNAAAAETRNDPAARELARLIDHAIQVGATDIGLTPQQDGTTQVLLRRSGDLIAPKTGERWPNDLAHGAIRLLETKSGANPSLTAYRTPRDGQIAYRSAVGSAFMRLSFIPLNHIGEVAAQKSVSARLFANSESIISIDSLGLHHDVIRAIDDAVRMPQGLILLAGPMNSGKSTTIAAALGRHVTLYGSRRKRVSVEDPVERYIGAVTQINVPATVQGRDGLPLSDRERFNCILRGIKRHDANAIWIGEVRDAETAEICTTFASSGHLVLSTIHAKSAMLAYDILSKMVPADTRLQLIESMALIVSQRLVRTLCQHCATRRAPTEEDTRLWTHYLAMLGEDTTLPPQIAAATSHAASGCTHCDDGYAGVTPVSEVLPFTRSVRDAAYDMLSGRNAKAAIDAGRTLTLLSSSHALLCEGRVDLPSILFL